MRNRVLSSEAERGHPGSCRGAKTLIVCGRRSNRKPARTKPLLGTPGGITDLQFQRLSAPRRTRALSFGAWWCERIFFRLLLHTMTRSQEPAMTHTAERTCPHCKGTGYCSACADTDGALTCEPSCESCKARAHLKLSEALYFARCSVCGGTGHLRPFYEYRGESDYLARSLPRDRFESARIPGRVLRNILVTLAVASLVSVAGAFLLLFLGG